MQPYTRSSRLKKTLSCCEESESSTHGTHKEDEEKVPFPGCGPRGPRELHTNVVLMYSACIHNQITCLERWGEDGLVVTWSQILMSELNPRSRGQD